MGSSRTYGRRRMVVYVWTIIFIAWLLLAVSVNARPASPTEAPSGAPSWSPSAWPSKGPSVSPSAAPTPMPSMSPSSAPTCYIPDLADYIWILDESGSIQRQPGPMQQFLQYIVEFTATRRMGPNATREGYVQFAGTSIVSPLHKAIGTSIPLTDESAVNETLFTGNVSSLVFHGGTTSIVEAVDYVRTYMLTPENYRPGSTRYVILATDAGPTNIAGIPTTATPAETAVSQLIAEDNVLFYFVKTGNSYPDNFLVNQSVAIYHIDNTTSEGFQNSFFCVQSPLAPSTTPSKGPSAAPSVVPSTAPSSSPISSQPSQAPTQSAPTISPSAVPSQAPSITPSAVPSETPSKGPSAAPSAVPSTTPSSSPISSQPSQAPTQSAPTISPSAVPSQAPSITPSAVPSETPSKGPSAAPSAVPSTAPSSSPISSQPSQAPTQSAPTISPSAVPSQAPSITPSAVPSETPSKGPSAAPSAVPSTTPSSSPISSQPSQTPTQSAPTISPSAVPSQTPSTAPSSAPSTSSPSKMPSRSPSSIPSVNPSQAPSQMPSKIPTASSPTAIPSRTPSTSPSIAPSSSAPSFSPTTSSPSQMPSAAPSEAPSTSEPTASPTCFLPSDADFFWMIDGSMSSDLDPTMFPSILNLVTSFSNMRTFGDTATRGAYLVFAGDLLNITIFTTVNDVLNITDTDAKDQTLFDNRVNGLVSPGGSTNYVGAFDYVRTAMVRPDNDRPGSTRYVILVTDGRPTTDEGFYDLDAGPSNAAAAQLKTEDGIWLAAVLFGGQSAPGFMDNVADTLYEVPTPGDMSAEVLAQKLCSPRDTHGPTQSPSQTPSTAPSNAPSETQTDGPSQAPTSSKPSTVPSASPPTSTPSHSPSVVPTTSSPSVSPSKSPTTSTPSAVPSSAPSSAPSAAPTACQPSTLMDIIWVADGSFSMTQSPQYFAQLMALISNTTLLQQPGIGPNGIRQGFLEFAGPQAAMLLPFFNETIGPNLNVTDPMAVTVFNFSTWVLNQTALGGSTNSPGALDFVQTAMFTTANYRPTSKRVVVFATDGWSTDFHGDAITDPSVLGNAVTSLQATTGAKVILIPIGPDFPSELLTTEPDYRVSLDIAPAALVDLFATQIMCLGSPTSTPSQAPIVPTQQPSGAPTSSPGCVANPMVDLVWMIDESTWIDQDLGEFPLLLQYIQNFATGYQMGPTGLRQGFVEYAGPFDNPPPFTQTIGESLNVTDLDANDDVLFADRVGNLVANGGTLDIAGAFDFVRTAMLTPTNYRPGSKRVVVLTASIGPSFSNGSLMTDMTSTYQAAEQLKTEDGVRLVYLQAGLDGDYPPNFMVGVADYIAAIYGETNATEAVIGNTLCTSQPTIAPTLETFNMMDLVAFNELSDALNRTSWTECNKTSTDPCDVCYNPNENQAVVCDSLPVTGRRRLASDESVPLERRIVGLRLRNIGIKGVLPLGILAKFTALRELRLSLMDASNHLEVGGNGCVDASICAKLVECDISNAPICGQAQPPPTTSSLGAMIGIGISVSLVALLVVGIAIASLRRRNGRAPASSNGWRTVELDQATGGTLAQNDRTGEFAWSMPMTTGSEEIMTIHVDGKDDSIINNFRPRRTKSSTSNVTRKPENGRATWINPATGEFSFGNPLVQGECEINGDVEHSPSPKRTTPHPSPLRRKASKTDRSSRFSTGTAMVPRLLTMEDDEDESSAFVETDQWKAVMDEDTKDRYWINTRTGEFSWTSPSQWKS